MTLTACVRVRKPKRLPEAQAAWANCISLLAVVVVRPFYGCSDPGMPLSSNGNSVEACSPPFPGPLSHGRLLLFYRKTQGCQECSAHAQFSASEPLRAEGRMRPFRLPFVAGRGRANGRKRPASEIRRPAPVAEIPRQRDGLRDRERTVAANPRDAAKSIQQLPQIALRATTARRNRNGSGSAGLLITPTPAVSNAVTGLAALMETKHWGAKIACDTRSRQAFRDRREGREAGERRKLPSQVWA